MRRLLVLACVISGVLVTASGALAEHGDASPRCADVRNADFFYNPNGTVVVNLETEQPTCPWVTYTLHVLVDENETVSRSVSGNESTTLQIISPTFQDDDGQVCAYVTTSVGGRDGTKHIFDQAAGTGTECVTLTPGTQGGTGFH